MPLPEAMEPLHGFFMLVSFVLGALIGSFANVCVSRWPAGESVVSPRSRCPKCREPIAWYDNLPILSWLILGAKCRHCKTAISWQYPLVEAITGFLFLAAYWRFGLSAATPIYMAFCAAMVVVTFQDLADWTIPNEITLPGIPIGLVVSLGGLVWPEASGLRVTNPIDALLGILLGGGILYALDWITVVILKKPGMGMGDVKLLALIGAFIGWQGVLGTLMTASILGSIIGLGTILFWKLAGKDATEAMTPEFLEEEEGGKASQEDGESGDDDEAGPPVQGHYIPFGPYLAVAGLLFLFFGPELIDLYLQSLQPEPLTPYGIGNF